MNTGLIGRTEVRRPNPGLDRRIQRHLCVGVSNGFVTGILGAAIRLGSIGHLQAQQILLQLAPNLEQAYDTASSMDIDRMWSCTLAIALAQTRHSKLSSRLFAN